MDDLAHVVSSLIAVYSLRITVQSLIGISDTVDLVCNLKHGVPQLVVLCVLLISNVPLEGRDTDSGHEVEHAGEGARPHGELLCEVGRLAEREDIGGVDGEIGELVEGCSPVLTIQVVERVIESIELYAK